jgi:hypothetical protein
MMMSTTVGAPSTTESLCHSLTTVPPGSSAGPYRCRTGPPMRQGGSSPHRKTSASALQKWNTYRARWTGLDEGTRRVCSPLMVAILSPEGRYERASPSAFS